MVRLCIQSVHVIEMCATLLTDTSRNIITPPHVIAIPTVVATLAISGGILALVLLLVLL